MTGSVCLCKSCEECNISIVIFISPFQSSAVTVVCGLNNILYCGVLLITSISGSAHHHQFHWLMTCFTVLLISMYMNHSSVLFVSALTSRMQQFIIICSNHLSFFTLSLLRVLWTLYVSSVIITLPSNFQSVFIPPPLLLLFFLLNSFLPCTPFLSFFLPPLCPLPLSCTGRGNLRPQLDSAMQDVSDLYLLMEETEKQAVRRALLEERGRYCSFINLLQPVVVRNFQPLYT